MIFKTVVKQQIGTLSVALMFITLVAFFLRVVLVSSIPPSLAWDEVAFGYNAYTLGIDGKDEFGVFLPLTYLESFGDFKPVVYAYLSVLPIKLFGLNEFSVRLPSVILGTLTVFLSYFLVLRLFPKSVNKEYYALATALLLAVSPWHINLSRAAFEANVASFFIVAGVWAFLGGVQDKKWYLLLSACFFSLSIYTFNTPRIVVPILVAVMAIGTWRALLKNKKQTTLAVLLGLLLVLPTVPFLLSPQASLRFKEVNIFSDITVIERVNQEIQNDENSLLSRLLHNRRLAFGVEYLKHYLDTFTPGFLFVYGDENRRFSTGDVGLLYLFELPCILLGAIMLLRKREGYWWMIPVWILIAIIPGATARETPHALRLETLIPTFQILSGMGLVTLLIWATAKRQHILYRAGIGVVSCIAVLLVFSYLHGYYKHYAYEQSYEWQYSYKDAVSYAGTQENNYDHIYVSENLGRPYIYFLFYQKTDPKFFRKTAIVHRDTFGFVKVKGFGKYRFGEETETAKHDTGKKLFISIPEDIPKGATKLKTFTTLNGETVFIAYTI